VESGDCNFEALEIGKDGFGVNEHRKITSADDLHDFLMPLIPLL
jgi:hypothetical protein